MKSSEIKALSVEELKDKISSSEKALQSLKFGNAISPIENPMQIRDVRRLVARLKTELHARDLEALKGKAGSGDLTNLNAKAFMADNKFDSTINLAKVKKVIKVAGK
ncbi:50S ribosomal protein L29 [Chondrinema litorale]|uniref:50S ribosomal protein L29 n=1 Tax=Chondrinema litorale TaxID=2994555 RepID=UPI0032B45F21